MSVDAPLNILVHTQICDQLHQILLFQYYVVIFFMRQKNIFLNMEEIF